MDIDPVDPAGAPSDPVEALRVGRGAETAVEAMRDGVWARTRRWLAGSGAHRWSPRALMVMMATGAYAPLLMSGNTDSALLVTGAATASVGANVITEILQGGVDHLRAHGPSLGEVEEWLAGRLEEVLEAGGQQSTVLQGQLALIFDEINATQTALGVLPGQVG